jgi:TonB family protein
VTLWPRGLLALALATSAAAASGAEIPVVNMPMADVPADVALRDEQKVTVAFTPAEDGRTKTCRIVRKSKEPRLDAASCRIVTERARFAPNGEQRLVFVWDVEKAPHNSRASPGDPLLIMRENWITEEDYPSAAVRNDESGHIWYRMDVSASGLPQRCTIVESSGSAVLDAQTCHIAMQRAIFIPASDGKGGVKAGHGIYAMEWRIG